MGDDVLKAAFKRVAESGLCKDGLTLVWHAGEPLVLPISYYQHAFQLAEEWLPQDIKVRHSFQTNGMLINNDWCDFLSQPNVTIGLSIDGPKRLHDNNRVSRTGVGSFDKAIKGLRLLRSRGVPFHVISVLTRESLFFPDELFEFFIEEGVDQVCFNIEEVEGENKQSSLSASECSGLFIDFMNRFHQLCSDDDRIKYVREFDRALGAIVNRLAPQDVSQQARPYSIISVAWNGDFTTYSPELLGLTDERFGDFVLGNVTHDRFDDALESPKFKQMASEIKAGVDRCRNTCSYYSVCGGGAPVNKLFETGTFDAAETLYCKYYTRLITDVFLTKLEKSLDEEMAQMG